ncbi:MAG: hypothetical protein KA165_04110 [Saprospiraceae bacterium]|nr:hypothetical protein [Saprospiraceae bacterium]
MKTTSFFLQLFLLIGLMAEANAQTGRPATEKIWKDLSRLPQNLRDDLAKSPWWKSNPGGGVTAGRLDSIIKLSHFNKDKYYPINKTQYDYPSALSTVLSDFVNYGEWILQKRTTLTFDAKKRITEVLEEEPDPNSGFLQPVTKWSLFWRGDSDSRCDSILSSRWDDQLLQWSPSIRLISVFDAQNREIATETYRYDGGFQALGIREEFQLDAAGDVTLTRQYLAKDGKWTLLGKVESTFDKQHHEITRLEDVALDAGKFASVRKLRRSFDAQGKMTLEERFKWNEASSEWAPLKTISKGANEKNHSEWAETESYKPNAFFKNKVVHFKRPADKKTEKEVFSTLQPDSKSWQVLSEVRYYYAK